MKLAQAIAKAVEMGGAEVWRDGELACVVRKDGAIKTAFFEINGDEEWYNSDIYCVRPLSPEEFGFNEAWERLKNGEQIRITQETSLGIDERSRKLCHFISSADGGAWHIPSLKGKRFTAVEE